MVTSFVLFAVETVPLLTYIFVGLVVLAVPTAVIWDKVIQPKLDAKKKAAKETKTPIEGAADVAPVMEGIEAVEEDGQAEGVEQLAMPGEGDVGGDELSEGAAFVAEPSEAAGEAGEGFAIADGTEPNDLDFEEMMPDDGFSIDTDEKK